MSKIVYEQMLYIVLLLVLKLVLVYFLELGFTNLLLI